MPQRTIYLSKEEVEKWDEIKLKVSGNRGFGRVIMQLLVKEFKDKEYIEDQYLCIEKINELIDIIKGE